MELARQIVAGQTGTFFAWPRVGELGGWMARMGCLQRRQLPRQLGAAEVLLAQCLVAVQAGAQAPSDPQPAVEFALRDWLHNHLDQPTDLNAIAAALGCRGARCVGWRGG